MSEYLGVFLLLLVSAGFLISMLLLAIYLGPKKRTAEKDIPFECGINPLDLDVSNKRFGVGFYHVAILFILFDVEVLFLYPWALNPITNKTFIAMICFLSVLFVGYVYIWRKGILDWNKK